MQMTERLMKFASNPNGFWGTIAARFMNSVHDVMYAKALDGHRFNPNSICLDVGCGGGRLLSRIADRLETGKAYGIDHSADMVRTARKANSMNIDLDIVDVFKADVTDLPFRDDSFDLVTASETIQFWPGIEQGLMEIRRVLKPGGTLMIINRYAAERDDVPEMLPLKSENDYSRALEGAGFAKYDIDSQTHKKWLVAKAWS